MARRSTTGMGGHQSASADMVDWVTPREEIERLGGAESFDRDPCAAPEQPWPCAQRSWNKHDDGLGREWDRGESIFMNPPYGSEAAIWLDRLAAHGNGIALIFSRTETDDFFTQIWEKATAILFRRGRLFFHYGAHFTDRKGRDHVPGERARGNGGAPSVLIAYGAAQAKRLRECEIAGIYFDIADGVMLPGRA